MQSGNKGKGKMVVGGNNQTVREVNIVQISGSSKGKRKVTTESNTEQANITSLVEVGTNNEGRIYRKIKDELNSIVAPPPVFASDEQSYCCEWNVTMEKITGYRREEVIGKLLAGDIFGKLCRINSYEMQMSFAIFLFQAITGQYTKCFVFEFLNARKKSVKMFLSSDPRYGPNGDVVGCRCLLEKDGPHEISPVNIFLDSGCKELTYLRHEMISQVCGSRVINKLLENKLMAGKPLTDVERQFCLTTEACEKQILSILTDIDLETMGEGRMELKMQNFVFGDFVHAVVSQVMIRLNEKGLDLTIAISDQIKTLVVYADKMKLQLVLTNLLIAIVQHSPQDSWIEFGLCVVKELFKDGKHYLQIRFRMTHPSPGLPSLLIEDMDSQDYTETTDEGLSLFSAQKLLRLMDGHVEYVSTDYSGCFVGVIELQTHKKG